MNSVALPAAEPGNNITVRASAGTGKTWLLITRLIRLLLSGAAPDSILAVTFTRKAAAEMQCRLRERLYSYLELDDVLLDSELQQIGLIPDHATRHDARRLFENLLRSEHPIKVTTYHAFCQDVLRRFPFDAGVPPGFELVESEGLLAGEAWDALIAEASMASGSDMAKALQTLLDYHGNIDGPRNVLLTFHAQRIDWWAYTHGEADPVAYATESLRRQLKIDEDGDPAAGFFNDLHCTLLREFAELLARHATATNLRHSALIQDVLNSDAPPGERLEILAEVFFRQDGEPRARKESATLQRKLGEASMARLLTLNHQLCEALLAVREQLRRRLTLAINTAWYRAGCALLAHYRRLKEERRLLDFADLEWHTYLLLRHSDNALWVQYKLDRRIDHLLVDEFQDTNPSQWAMLLPLLEELAAGDPERQRSVFLVGDAKQSIYRFRRANPHLFGAAGHWLETHLEARECTLNKSRRSAPAIMEFVNRVFCKSPLGERLAPFPHHDTYLQTLWGRVEMLPLIDRAAVMSDDTSTNGRLRDPLCTPRTSAEPVHYLEGRLIAARLEDIIVAGTLLGEGENTRPAAYEDIMILVRSRTHIHHYERALREAGIPYLGSGKTTLLDCLEVQDMVALLETLIAPYNNLALAAVLRSPLFSCSDEDLITLAKAGRERKGHWFALLQELAPQLPADSTLGRAASLLMRWRGQADQVPMHDLLDRIYCEGNVLARYQAGFPPHLRQRAQANLVRFIELALAVDSGRYPSLPHFLARIRSLQQHDQDALDEAPTADHQAGVRIMTIHAAKGLEAPIVFLADAARAEKRRRAFQLLLDWPADAPQPRAFLLGNRSREADRESQRLAEEMEAEEQIEETNLLYVALTRARQWLIVSGCADRYGRPTGWYDALARQLGDAENIAQKGWSLATGIPPAAVPPATAPAVTAAAVDPRLARPLDAPPLPGEIAPSAAVSHDDRVDGEEGGRQRGIVIHRLLERLSSDPRPEPGAVLEAVAGEFHYPTADPRLKRWWQEAVDLLNNPAFATLFDSGRYHQAWNEIPLTYQGEPAVVNGIIDRLVLTEDEAWVVDYKTHSHAHLKNLSQLAAPYHEQLALYREGVQRLWPDRRVRVLLLFTACGERYEFEA